MIQAGEHRYHFITQDGWTASQLCMAAEAAFRLGFFTVSQVFPVASAVAEPGALNVQFDFSAETPSARLADAVLVLAPGGDTAALLGCLTAVIGENGLDEVTVRSAAPGEAYRGAEASARPIPLADWRSKKGLESLFAPGGGFFADTDLDLLADSCRFQVVVPAKATPAQQAVCLSLAFRMGMETTGCEGPLFVTAPTGGNRFVFDRTEAAPGMLWQPQADGSVQIVITGDGAPLEAFGTAFCNSFPLEGEQRALDELLRSMIDAAAWKNADGQKAALELAVRTGQRVSALYANPELLEEKAALETAYGCRVESWQGLVPVWNKDFTAAWEVDRLRGVLAERLTPLVKPGDIVTVEAAVSEDPETRRALETELAASMPGCTVKAEVLCAYKQGYSWLTEQVAPALKALGRPLKGLVIRFRACRPEGMSDWGSEAGVIPTLNKAAVQDENHWMELPLRFLQELYPVDDALAESLGIPREAVTFALYEGTDGATYMAEPLFADGADGETRVYRYTVPVREQPYLAAFPQLGKVHPAVGWVRAAINGAAVLEEMLPTDTETVWDFYQNEVLSAAGETVLARTGGTPRPEAQPFFSQLKLDLEISEPDYRLPTREDLFSSLDALHEDMYFVGYDYFKQLGLASPAGAALDAPGLIYPEFHSRPGAPHLHATLYQNCRAAPCLATVEGEQTAPFARGEVQLYAEGLGWDGEKLVWHLAAESEKPEKTAELAAFYGSYAALLAAGRLEVNRWLSGAGLVLRCGENTVKAEIPPCAQPKKDLTALDVPLYENQVIGYEQYLDAIEALRRVPGITVVQTAFSYNGRRVHAIEFDTGRRGYISRVKLLSRGPSLYINARHHANEDSSTNAALKLIRTLLTEPRYAHIGESIRLAVVPMENPDGAAIHYHLQKEHPHWKYHIARYNALGKEFAHAYFEADPLHREADTMTWLWHRMLPDIQVDDHGVPSHEWEQPFSGYASPMFKGFWLPRSLLYDYFWVLEKAGCGSNQNIDRAMEKVIADAVNADEEISAWNAEWQERFEKYAHGWMPSLFPADYYRGVINYWIRYPESPARTPYNSLKYPWITSTCYTSEVADETAQDEYLGLCARTHVVQDLAILDLVLSGKSVYAAKADGLCVACRRRRPLVLGPGLTAAP